MILNPYNVIEKQFMMAPGFCVGLEEVQQEFIIHKGYFECG